MRWRALLGLAAASAALLLGPASASAQAVSADGLRRLDAFLQADTAPGAHLGAVALVAQRGQIVYHKAFGQRDLARREPMALDNIFRIYSMTKPVVSVALLMLLEEGRLTLDDPVAMHLPYFAGQRVWTGGTADAPQLREPARRLTVRHLMTHSAGLATGGGDAARSLLERAAPWAATNLDDYARRVAKAPLAADPGTRFQYDGVNTEVLSRIIEVVSGQPFDIVLQRRIFDPLRLVDTGFSVPAAQRHRIADISAVGPDGSLVLATGPSATAPGVPLNAYFSGAGGLYSTAADYLRFCRMLLNGGTLDGVRLLGRKTVDLMRTNHLAHLDPIAGLSAGEGFGLGVSVIIDPARRGRLSSAGAYGWSGAATTYFTIDPQEQMIAILLMQHLPRDDLPGELPKPSVTFYNLVYQALQQ